MVIVTVHTFQLDRSAVDHKDAILQLDGAKPNALRDYFDHIVIVIVHRCQQTVQIRVFSGPVSRRFEVRLKIQDNICAWCRSKGSLRHFKMYGLVLLVQKIDGHLARVGGLCPCIGESELD